MDCWSTPSSLRSSLPWPCKLFSTFSDQFFTIIQTPLLSHSESPKKPNSHVWCFFLLQVKIATQLFIADLAALCVHTLGTPWLTEWWYVWRGNAPTSFQITSKYFTQASRRFYEIQTSGKSGTLTLTAISTLTRTGKVISLLTFI